MSSIHIKFDSTPDLVDQDYRSLLEAISQEEVADQLAVSRHPVLLALRPRCPGARRRISQRHLCGLREHA
jgi:hypothetical protein